MARPPEPDTGVTPPLPDLRILQANERTFLAWVRTGLGIIVLGFGLTRLNAFFEPGSALATPWAFPLGLGFAVVGLAVIPIATWRHYRIFRDLCANRPVLPNPKVALVFAGALVALGVALLALVITHGP